MKIIIQKYLIIHTQVFIFIYIFNNSMFKSEEKQRVISLDVLQDFQINTKDDWVNWEFQHEDYQDIPLSFNNRYNFYKNIRYSDLANLSGKLQAPDYMMVEVAAKKKNKQFISKNVRVTEKRVQGNPTTKQYTKKVQKFWRPWQNQNKTNFKKITVKNDWKQMKTINKNTLQGLPNSTDYTVEQIKRVGKIRGINNKLGRVTWTPIRFKENQNYQVEAVATEKDTILTRVAQHILDQEETPKQYNVICSPQFLLALLTLRGAVYPWNIEITKDGNIMVLESYRSPDQQNDEHNLNYLDLFVANQNTTNHMPIDENKVKQTCLNATKLTKIFQDLLASEDFVELDETQPESEIFKPQEGQEEEEEEFEEEKLEKLRKYLRIGVGKFDIFTFIDIDGIKQNDDGTLEKYLIRSFMQSETQGAWINDMKTSPGSIITKEYHANNCSIQKWICEAKLAGVDKMKLGYMGYDHNKPVLLNVSDVTVQGIEKTLSFKMQSCWSSLNYVLDLVSEFEDGTYVLAKAPYTPLSIKLYQISKKQESDQEDDQ